MESGILYVIDLLEASFIHVDSSRHPEILVLLKEAQVEGLEDFEDELACRFEQMRARGIKSMRKVPSICGDCHKGLPVLNFLTNDDPFFNLAVLVRYSTQGELQEIQFCEGPLILDQLLHEHPITN